MNDFWRRILIFLMQFIRQSNSSIKYCLLSEIYPASKSKDAFGFLNLLTIISLIRKNTCLWSLDCSQNIFKALGLPKVVQNLDKAGVSERFAFCHELDLIVVKFKNICFVLLAVHPLLGDNGQLKQLSKLRQIMTRDRLNQFRVG